MLEQQDLTNLEHMMRNIVTESEGRMKEHVADSILQSETRMKEHVADSILQSETRMKEHVADSILQSETRMKEHVADSIHASENLMLDEMERYSGLNLKKIEKLEQKMDCIYPYCQINRTDTEHMNNLMKLYYKLQERLESHDKILSRHRTELDTHEEQLTHLMAVYA